MSRLAAKCAAIALIVAAASPAFGAAGTTCLCRSDDGTSFVASTHRHSRWACDYKLGYLKAQDAKSGAPRRLDTQTCNAEEMAQYKVWACMERGCKYQYAQSVDRKNTAPEQIEPIKGERRP